MDESKVTRYATEKYVDKNNINDSEIDEVFNELSMKSLKRYKINYDYDKSMCSLNPTPSYMYGNDEVYIQMNYDEMYYMESISIIQGKNDITNDVFSNDKKLIKLNSITNDINIKIVFGDNSPT